jgi:hypothetical protein
MAKLYLRTTDAVTLGCYSERGIMSYFMFRVLASRLSEFLALAQFSNGNPNRLKLDGPPQDIALFSELDFGNEGFGKPDGAIWFRHRDRPHLVLMEVKLNQSYRAACSPTASYNSTIRGQLELKWRLMRLFKAGQIVTDDGVQYVAECDPMLAFYRDKDRIYSRSAVGGPLVLGNRRRLRLVQGVGEFFQRFVTPCAFEDIFYIALTVDTGNPLDSNKDLLPRCCDAAGCPDESAVRQFAWINTSVLESWQ